LLQLGIEATENTIYAKKLCGLSFLTYSVARGLKLKLLRGPNEHL